MQQKCGKKNNTASQLLILTIMPLTVPEVLLTNLTVLLKLYIFCYKSLLLQSTLTIKKMFTKNMEFNWAEKQLLSKQESFLRIMECGATCLECSRPVIPLSFPHQRRAGCFPASSASPSSLAGPRGLLDERLSQVPSSHVAQETLSHPSLEATQ